MPINHRLKNSAIPVEASRSGDLDPGLVSYLARTEEMSATQFQKMVNHESGLLGVSETSSDMRDLLEHDYGMADNRIGVARLDLPEHLPPGAPADGPRTTSKLESCGGEHPITAAKPVRVSGRAGVERRSGKIHQQRMCRSLNRWE